MNILNTYRWVFLLVIVLAEGVSITLHAQTTPGHKTATGQTKRDQDKTEADTSGVRLFLERMQRTYREASYLGFNVNYFYANAGKPGSPLDSLSGEVALDKGRTRFAIDGTETVVTGKYSIHVIKGQKLIYLSKTSHMGMMDPVGVLDSVLAHQTGIKAGLEKNGLLETLTIQFPPGQQYKRVQLTADPKTGLLQRVEFALYTAGVVGQEAIDRPGHPGMYQSEGRVEIIFTRYRKNAFGDALFDEGNYFTRTGNRFEPAGLYKDYQIFLASSNL